MATLTETDYINANLVADRILLRKLFEELRDRPQSKYFKNIIITNVKWEEKTFCGSKMPLNFPPEFLKKYPFDFDVYYDTLGCNMLKCYGKCKKSSPILINDYIYAQSESCYAIYEEFNSYLKEKFQIKKNIVESTDDCFPFETFSIHDEVLSKDFCGIQLKRLKEYAILPSSRWINSEEEEDNVYNYVKKYKDDPIKLTNVAGLVDAPPLTWNTETQNVNFNKKYCSRFIKQYDYTNDNCYERLHRKGLRYLFGQNIVNAFPDLDFIILNKSLPLQYVTKAVMGKELDVNNGYEERKISQRELENHLYTQTPDKITRDTRIIYPHRNASFGYLDERKIIEFNNIFYDILRDLGTEVGIEAAFTTTPAIMSRLLKHYSEKFLHHAIKSTNVVLPVSIRLMTLTTRMIMIDMSIKLAIKFLTLASSMANILFTVTIITIIPDIILNYYNIGGFNNEITREHLDKLRKLALDNILKMTLQTYKDIPLNYIVIGNEDYVSPIITPEFVYYLCLINFLTNNPQMKMDINHNGISQFEHYDVVLEYLTSLKVNSIGQRLMMMVEEEEEEEKDMKLDNKVESKNNNNNNNIFKRMIHHNQDLYFLIIGVVLIIIAILTKTVILSTICIYSSLSCFVIWFSIFRHQI